MPEYNATTSTLVTREENAPKLGLLYEGSFSPLDSGSVGGPTAYFKMRCRDDGVAPPGYVIWIVTGVPDDDASEATLVGSPVAGSIAVMSTWQI